MILLFGRLSMYHARYTQTRIEAQKYKYTGLRGMRWMSDLHPPIYSQGVCTSTIVAFYLTVQLYFELNFHSSYSSSEYVTCQLEVPSCLCIARELSNSAHCK